MRFQTGLNLVFVFIILALSVTVMSLHNRLLKTEVVVKQGGIYAEFVKTKQVTVVNPNGIAVIKLESDPQGLSGFGDGLILVNEGQGIENKADKMKASVHIRANAELGGMVAAQSHRVFQQTPDGRIKLEPIHPTRASATPQETP